MRSLQKIGISLSHYHIIELSNCSFRFMCNTQARSSFLGGPFIRIQLKAKSRKAKAEKAAVFARLTGPSGRAFGFKLLALA
jgi:hypothetical protein